MNKYRNRYRRENWLLAGLALLFASAVSAVTEYYHLPILLFEYLYDVIIVGIWGSLAEPEPDPIYAAIISWTAIVLISIQTLIA